MTIRFVYFDLGNILFSFDRDRASSNVAALLDVDFDAADNVLHGTGLHEELEHGRLSNLEYATQVCDQLNRSNWLGSQTDLEAAVALVADAISDMFTPIDEMAEVLADTRAKVGRIGILSNTCEAHWDWIARMQSPILDHEIDQTVLSCRVNSMKPDQKIYLAAQTLADCQPSEILFVDDREENVAAAKSLGWNAEVCLGGSQAIDVLRSYGAVEQPTPGSPATSSTKAK